MSSVIFRYKNLGWLRSEMDEWIHLFEIKNTLNTEFPNLTYTVFTVSLAVETTFKLTNQNLPDPKWSSNLVKLKTIDFI